MLGLTKKEIKFWHRVSKGDYFSLTDSQSIEMSGNEKGARYTIVDKKIINIKDSNFENAIEYIIFDIEYFGIIYYLVVIGNGDLFEIRFYFVPRDWSLGDRDHYVDNQQTWFWLLPENPDDFECPDLEFAEYAYFPLDGIEYEFKFSGFKTVLFGEYTNNKKQIPTLVVEYETDSKDLKNNKILVIEEGFMNQNGDLIESGGYITTMLGCSISLDEIHI